MNGTNRTSLVIGMVAVLVGILSSAVFAENPEREGVVDATVVQVTHWQTMNPDVDSTVTQVAHWQTMNPGVDSTVTQVAHWQTMAEVFAADVLAQVDAEAVAEVVSQR